MASDHRRRGDDLIAVRSQLRTRASSFASPSQTCSAGGCRSSLAVWPYFAEIVDPNDLVARLEQLRNEIATE